MRLLIVAKDDETTNELSAMQEIDRIRERCDSVTVCSAAQYHGVSFKEVDAVAGYKLNGAGSKVKNKCLGSHCRWLGFINSKSALPDFIRQHVPPVPKMPRRNARAIAEDATDTNAVQPEAAVDVQAEVVESETDAAVLWNYRGTMIGMGDDQFVDMTAMWRANGSPENKRPNDYLDTRGAKELGEQILRETPTAAKSGSGLYRQEDRKRRPNGTLGPASTKGHWMLAVDYGMYLNVEFHTWCLRTIKATVEGKAPVALSPRDALRQTLAVLDEQDQRIAQLEAHVPEAVDNAVRPLLDTIGVLSDKVHDLEIKTAEPMVQVEAPVDANTMMTLSDLGTLKADFRRFAYSCAVETARYKDQRPRYLTWAYEMVYSKTRGAIEGKAPWGPHLKKRDVFEAERAYLTPALHDIVVREMTSRPFPKSHMKPADWAVAYCADKERDK